MSSLKISLEEINNRLTNKITKFNRLSVQNRNDINVQLQKLLIDNGFPISRENKLVIASVVSNLNTRKNLDAR